MIIFITTYFLLRFSGDTEAQDDLLDYINDTIPKAHQLENRAWGYYDSVSGAHYVSNKILLDKRLKILTGFISTPPTRNTMPLWRCGTR